MYVTITIISILLNKKNIDTHIYEKVFLYYMHFIIRGMHNLSSFFREEKCRKSNNR